jgi:hypothetical protein
VLQLPEDTPEVNAPSAAELQIDLKWDTAVSDFDLEAVGPDGSPYESIEINALGSPIETVYVPGVRQCERIEVVAQNFAGSPLDVLRLEVIATGSEL